MKIIDHGSWGLRPKFRWFPGALLATILLSAAQRAAADPAWWTNRNVLVASATNNDFAAVNMGQLKWIATNACAELQAHLPGGAGSSLLSVLNGWLNDNTNFVPVNVGQLKYLASLYYTRLIAQGYTNAYPWTPDTNASDFAVANIGQVKSLFAFDIATDSNGDGIPDWWEIHYFGSTNVSPTDDTDGDGFLNGYEFQHNTDPTNSASVPVPTLRVNPADSNAFATIQAALDAATNGYDIIAVANGSYSGTGNKNLHFPSVPAMLMSTGGPIHVTIDCGGNGRGVLFNNAETRATVLNGFTIQNGSTNFGGGVACANSAPTIENCVLANNAAGQDGGGVDLDGASPVIQGCVISNNTALTHGGGGISCWGGSSPLIRNSVIVSNTAMYGGGMYAYGIVLLESNQFTHASTPTLRNCLLAWNAASTNGGALYASPGAQPLLENCTLTANTAGDLGGGLFTGSGSNRNCIIYFNSAGDGSNSWSYGFGPRFDHSCLTPTNGLQGTANIGGDPAFVGSSNFRLSSGSPCRDAGTNANWMVGTFDLGGSNRIANGTVDIGAYEF